MFYYHINNIYALVEISGIDSSTTITIYEASEEDWLVLGTSTESCGNMSTRQQFRKLAQLIREQQ